MRGRLACFVAVAFAASLVLGADHGQAQASCMTTSLSWSTPPDPPADKPSITPAREYRASVRLTSGPCTGTQQCPGGSPVRFTVEENFPWFHASMSPNATTAQAQLTGSVTAASTLKLVLDPQSPAHLSMALNIRVTCDAPTGQASAQAGANLQVGEYYHASGNVVRAQGTSSGATWLVRVQNSGNAREGVWLEAYQRDRDLDWHMEDPFELQAPGEKSPGAESHEARVSLETARTSGTFTLIVHAAKVGDRTGNGTVAYTFLSFTSYAGAASPDAAWALVGALALGALLRRR